MGMITFSFQGLHYHEADNSHESSCIGNEYPPFILQMFADLSQIRLTETGIVDLACAAD